MFVKVDHTKSNQGQRTNTGSCKKLAEYLDKENNHQPESEKMDFFSHIGDRYLVDEVIDKIDQNKSKLKKGEDKFFSLSINPSQREQAFLIEKVTGRKVNDLSDLPLSQQQLVFNELKKYTRSCMDGYALNFNRDNIKSGSDLVYFAKIERQRHYRHYDPEVSAGSVRSGDLKPGLQLHVHVIVSRKDVTNSVSLSPLAASRGNKQLLNGKMVSKGFDREAWKKDCFKRFVDQTNYRHVRKESYAELSSMFLRVKGQMLGTAKSVLLQGEFQEERKVISNLRNGLGVLNPYQLARIIAKRQASQMIRKSIIEL